MLLPKRKNLRLKGYDYSAPGAYFITVCVRDRAQILGGIVGGDAHIVPKNNLSKYGQICKKYIENINAVYDNVNVDKYVIMPNHIHAIISLSGTMRASSPTITIPSIVSSFKALMTRDVGKSIWQRSFYDHVIRGKDDYEEIWEYIENNPLNWEKDEFYA